MEQVERGWEDFWAEIFRVRYRSTLQGIEQYDKMVADFCIEVLHLHPGDKLLDIASGAGDQSIEFAKHGVDVTGFDLAKSLIRVAQERARQEGVTIDFYQGDMRDMSYDQRFNAAVMLSHSFGFFNHEENKRVLHESYRALVDGGSLLLDLMNPYNLPVFQRTWTKLEGGYLLSEPHVFDAPAGVLRGRPATFIDVDAGVVVLASQDALANNDIRMYTAPEIQSLLEEVGFTKIELYGQNKLPRMPYTVKSDRLVAIATR
jgi:2-polyprenyl-3-methyl-5-hydroxy-6-metoxy-1,4-benzoquinol methylase